MLQLQEERSHSKDNIFGRKGKINDKKWKHKGIEDTTHPSIGRKK